MEETLQDLLTKNSMREVLTALSSVCLKLSRDGANKKNVLKGLMLRDFSQVLNRYMQEMTLLSDITEH